MVAATPLGDVVQQRRQIEDAARTDLGKDFRRQGVVFLQFPPLDTAQDTDGADGMLIHRINVVHVMLRLRHHAPKIGDETTHDTGLVHAG